MRTGTISRLISESREELSQKTIYDRFLHYIWIFGAYFLLFERSVADAWLTICSLGFLFQSIYYRELSWTKELWVKLAGLFWLCCLLSSMLSDMPVQSLGEAFVWIRFPLFAAATCFWFGKSKSTLKIFYCNFFVGTFLMAALLITEYLFIGPTDNRLFWPYGDPVAGNYLAKTGLAIYVWSICFVLNTRLNDLRSFFATIFIVLTTIASVWVGERVNFIIRFTAGMFGIIVWKISIKRVLIVLGIEISIIFGLLIFDSSLFDRYTSKFISQLPTSTQSSSYARNINAGIQIGLENKILGIGVNNHRILCSKILGANPTIECDNHPHNYYSQLFSETGIVGLILGSAFILSIVGFCFQTRVLKPNDILTATAFVVPLLLFFPIQSTMDFFGQWGNLFLWTGLSIAMSTRNLV